MWACYAIALIPVVIGAVLWLSSRRITFDEWMRGSLIGFAVAVGFHFYTLTFPALDVEMWSGKVINAVHRPERMTRSKKGSDPKTYDECWYATVDLGDEEERLQISQAQFDALCVRLGASQLTPVRAPGDFVGDSNNYVAMNYSDVFIPAYTLRSFENRARIDVSVHSYGVPPEGVSLFDHPAEVSTMPLLGYLAVRLVTRNDPSEPIPVELQCFDWRSSKRLIGRAAKDYNLSEWDRLCAELGPTKKVNLIMIGFDGDSMLAHWQESKWMGGKKNDLVLCYGPPTDTGTPAWTYCFGSTEDELVKRNLESLLLSSPPGDGLLAKIRDQVSANYDQKEYPALGYFDVPPPPSAIPTLVMVMILVQGGFWLWAFTNRQGRSATGEVELQDVADEDAREWDRIREKSAKDKIAERLVHLADPGDICQLTEELLQGSESLAACLALQRSRKPQAITSLVVGLSADDPIVQEAAADWLDDNILSPSTCPEARAALPALIKRLRHDNPQVRVVARAALDKVDPGWPRIPESRDGIPDLLQAVRSGDATDSIVDALGARGKLVEGRLLSITDQGHVAARCAALRALGRTGASAAADTLLVFLDHDDPALSSAAVCGLACFGPGLRDVANRGWLYEALMARLSGEESVDLDVIRALGWLGDERAVDTIAELLSDSDWSVRATAAEALGHLGSRDALPSLLGCADAVDDNANGHAIAAIGAIGDDTTSRRIACLLDRHPRSGPCFAEACIRVLGRLDDEDAQQVIGKIACDFMHAGNRVAVMYSKRFKRNRSQAQVSWRS